MNLRSLSLLAAVTATALPAQAVTVVQWDFESLTSGYSVTGTTASVLASVGTGSVTGMHAAATTVFSSPAGNGSPRSFSSNGWGVGDYYQFSFSSAGYAGLNISWDQVGSNTGPSSFSLAYSTDGTSFTNYTNYTVANVAWSGTGAPVTTSSYAYNLSSVTALNNASTVYIRLVDASTTAINGGTVATAGTGRIDNFTVSTTPVPEASTSAMLVAGLAAMGFLAKRRSAV